MLKSLLILLIAPLFAATHPFFVSVTEITHNAKEQSLEISCKIFTDDLEGAIRKSLNNIVDLSNPKDKAAADAAVATYIRKHFYLKADGRALNLQFVGFEKEGEAIWAYFEVTNIAALKKVEITNSILHDYQSKQINMMHVTINGNRQSRKLDYPDTRVDFNF
jgi:hypothetical protein